MRINWPRPTVTSNSGAPLSISCSRQSGGEFSVPGSYEVICKAEATCSFRVSLKRKYCPLYPPPKNGALACVNIDGERRSCAAMCKNGYDFVFNPPVLYYCDGGEWSPLSRFPFDKTLPWPDCSATANHSVFRFQNLPFSLYFDGDGNDPNVQEAIKRNFLSLLMSGLAPSHICKDKPSQCTSDHIEVYVGVVG